MNDADSKTDTLIRELKYLNGQVANLRNEVESKRVGVLRIALGVALGTLLAMILHTVATYAFWTYALYAISSAAGEINKDLRRELPKPTPFGTPAPPTR